MESHDDHYFDERDLQLLNDVGQYATTAVFLLGQDEVSGLLQRLVTTEVTGTPRLELLDGVKDAIGVDAGVVYVPDHQTKSFRVAFHVGCEYVPADLNKLEIGFEEDSITKQVFETGNACFVQNAASHPSAHPAARQMFGADDLAFVPLMFRKDKLGVLAVWRRSQNGSEINLDKFGPFANLIATYLVLQNSATNRSIVLRNAESILARMQFGLLFDDVIAILIRAMTDLGFKGVRA